MTLLKVENGDEMRLMNCEICGASRIPLLPPNASFVGVSPDGVLCEDCKKKLREVVGKL